MRILVAVLAAVAVAAPVHVALTAPGGHSPKVGTKWPYSVRVTSNGKLVRGKVTAEIVDPLGGHHYVQFGATTRIVHDIPFKGVFRDYVIWPAASRGVPLTFRLTVRAVGTTKVLRYAVVPRA